MSDPSTQLDDLPNEFYVGSPDRIRGKIQRILDRIPPGAPPEDTRRGVENLLDAARKLGKLVGKSDRSAGGFARRAAREVEVSITEAADDEYTRRTVEST